VRVLYIGRGLAKATLFGPAEVAEKFGLPPQRAGAAYAELAVLRGDPSDGLPGAAGIGEKTAATLLSRYGSLAGLLEAATDPGSGVAKGVRAKLAAAADYLEVAVPVVQVATDAPVALSRFSDALPRTALDPARVAELAAAYGVESSIKRLQKALDGLPD
jgi:5'-3' exonuclease